jgi:hypothetical protein
MTFSEYNLGQGVRLTAQFATFAGVLTNPTTTTFRVANITVNPPPDPTAADAVFGVDGAVTNDSAGVFHYDFVPAAAGNYVYAAVGEGAVAAVKVGYFRVKPSPFA